MKKQKSPDSQTHCLPIYMCLGIAVGTAIGTATDNLALYMPIGLSVGMCIGAMIDSKNRKTSDTSTENDENETQ